jgi:hypothetical protein
MITIAKRLSIVAVIFIFCLSTILGQNNKYFVNQYVKVPPTLENEYLKLEMDVWKKIHKARIDKDLLDGWYLYRVISPNGSKTEYNFVLTLQYNSPEKLAGHFESFGVDYTDILDAKEIAFALKTPEFRDQVYEEVWQTADELMNRNDDHMFRFQVFNAMRPRDGHTDEEYLAMEQKYWKPLHQMRVSMDRMHGWGLYTMIIPGGTERAYHWATVDYYDRFIDIMADNNALLAKIHGTKKLGDINEKTIEIRDQLRTEVRELLDYTSDSQDNN